MVNNMVTRVDKRAAAMLSDLAATLTVNHATASATWIPSDANVIADAVSRFTCPIAAHTCLTQTFPSYQIVRHSLTSSPLRAWTAALRT